MLGLQQRGVLDWYLEVGASAWRGEQRWNDPLAVRLMMGERGHQGRHEPDVGCSETSSFGPAMATTTRSSRLPLLRWIGCIGRRGFLRREQVRELAERGHVIGSHSVSHPPRFNALPFSEMVSEWSQSRAALEDIVGRRVDVGSVPGGYFSPAVARAARDAGLRVLFTSEPVTRVSEDGELLIVGRFTIRRGDPADRARRLVSAPAWARSVEWASWNAKGLVKPLLGPSYVRIADWLLATRPGRAS